MDPGAVFADPRHEKFAGEGNTIDTGASDAGAALALADAASAPMLLPAGATFLVGTDRTFTGKVVGAGGVLKPANGVTVTINGPFEAGPFQCFDLSLGGAVAFGPGVADRFLAQWWGVRAYASGASPVDSSAALTKALAAVDEVFLPAGFYWFVGVDVANKGIRGAGPTLTHLRGDGNLLVNAFQCKLKGFSIENVTTMGRLISYTDSTSGRSTFQDIHFGPAEYHIHAGAPNTTDWLIERCRFYGATEWSRYFSNTWALKEISCYTWQGNNGLRIDGGSSIEISDSVFEYNQRIGVQLEVTSSNPVIQVKFDGCHFESNGTVVAGPDVHLETAAALQIRNIAFHGCTFYLPTGPYRITATAGGGGNIGYVTLQDCHTNGVLMAPGTFFNAPLLINVVHNGVSPPSDATVLENAAITGKAVDFASVTAGGLDGRYLGVHMTAGPEGGDSTVQATITPPSEASLGFIIIQGDRLNLVAGTHDGYWIGVWGLGGRINTLFDVDASGGGIAQGFVVTWTGTEIQVANKPGMTYTQNARVLVRFS